MLIKLKQVVKYNGHSISANGAVNFNVVASYSELVKTIELTQLLNNDIAILAKLPDEPKAKKLGIFRIKQITIDGDGESKIKFDTLKDYVEVDNLNSLPLNSDAVKEFQLMYKADIELESEENEDGEEE